MKRFFLSFLIVVLIGGQTKAQDEDQPVHDGVVFNLSKDGKRYVKFTGLAQIWLRNTQMNPGTTISGFEEESFTDISIRRLRFQVYGEVADRLFFYTQFGQNNFNFNSTKYAGAFFHDAAIEYAAVREKFSIGGGLTGWSGLTRYASPSIGSTLALDAPLYQQATNGVNEQFIRKLSIYAKGQLGKLDYRIAISRPMTITGASNNATIPNSPTFSFSHEPAKMQLQGYFKYMFFDSESNLTPYQVGTYLGAKRVFNIGAGFIYQPDAMWALNDVDATIRHDMALFGLDVFYDVPFSTETALTLYGAFTNYDFGAGYVRNVGVNNPGTGSSNDSSFGNAYPMVGTGPSFYIQGGYMFGKDFISTNGKFQPYVSLQVSDYDFSDDIVAMYEVGANYFIHGNHNGKLSLVYQSRPIFGAGEIVQERSGMTVLQFHIAF